MSQNLEIMDVMSQEDVCKLWEAIYHAFTDVYSKIKIPEQGFDEKGGDKQKKQNS